MLRQDREVLAIAFVTADGDVRVWCSNNIETKDQHEWVGRQFQKGATVAMSMQPGAGRG